MFLWLLEREIMMEESVNSIETFITSEQTNTYKSSWLLALIVEFQSVVLKNLN